MIYTSIADTVGKTPLLELVNFEKKYALKAKLYAKLEYFNPAGSVKDRVAKEMIEEYEKQGVLKSGSTIIEPTSGNTGIGLACICASKGYKAIIVMPDTMSRERIMLMTAYGATIELTDGRLGMSGAIKRAEELAKTIPNSIIAGQFTNLSNPLAHYKTTGPEIWEDTNGDFNIFVATAGTGGTVSGTGKYIKEKNKDIKVIAVEPAASPYITEGKSGMHKIQGIGAGFLPETLDLSVVDETLTITDSDAYFYASEIAKTDGVLVGISSGAAIAAAKAVAERAENENKNIVLILTDTGERYLSSGLFE